VLFRPIAPLLLLLLCATACNPSKRFTLPVQQQGDAATTWTWTESPASPLLTRGPAGSWDSVDVLNPSVVRWRESYWNLYSGFDGKTWHTGVAQSADGLSWQRKGKVLSPDPASWEGTYIAANGAVLADRPQRLSYWYQGGRPFPSIGLARSSDGLSWSKEKAPVLVPGPRGSWDERGVADPYVIQIGSELYLYYTGMDRALRQRLGVARSSDGVRWEKSLDNPLLDIGGHQQWDEGGLGEPAVWSSGNSYWMLYTGRAWDETRRLGLAQSADGIHWKKLSTAVFEGKQPWNRSVLCDPTVELTSQGSLRVWYGGGNKPSPDENLNGQIGLATLTPK